MKKFLIIVPYRDRLEHLATLLPHLYWFLKGKKFEIAVIEQGDRRKFNKGLLFNVGFQIFGKKFDYFVLHDVDLIPVEANYSYPQTPVHLGTQLSQYGYKNIYPNHLHGVTIFNARDFEKINGFSVNYRGWGIEDEDLKLRCEKAGLRVTRRPGRFVSLPHRFKRAQIFDSIKNWKKLIENLRQGIFAQGLNTTKFKILSQKKNPHVLLPVLQMQKPMKIKAPHHHIVVVER